VDYIEAAVGLAGEQRVSGAMFGFKPGRRTFFPGCRVISSAHAASLRGIKSYIVMPHTAPEIKKKAVKGYGGEITFCEPTLQAREATLQRIESEKGITIIHPYNNFKVISGQGTAALELMNEIKNLD
jgi:threonine dehydratase